MLFPADLGLALVVLMHISPGSDILHMHLLFLLPLTLCLFLALVVGLISSD